MKRQDVITRLQIIHTWASHAVEHGYSIDWHLLEKIAEWVLDAVEMLKEDARTEDDGK